MKYTINFLFLTTLLMASISSYAQCVRIVGAGDAAVNGSYEIVAGQTYYKHTTANFWMDKNSNGYWAIFSQVNAPGSGCGCGHYYSDNSGSDPAAPGISWSTANNGSSPVPRSGDCLPDDSCELSTSLDTVCFGNSTTLSIVAGSELVNGSNWYWYRDSLNTTRIDSGASIVVTLPNATTTYYCRSENSSTSFTGDSSLITIIIKNTPGKPIISGCGNNNDTITLATDSNALATYLWGVSERPKTWDTLGSAGFSAGQVGYWSLAMDTSGTPYVLYMDGGNSNKATVMKYNGTAWVTLGSAGFSAGIAGYTSLAIDASGTPYAAYRDAGNSNKATVMKYNGTAWVTVGNAGFSAGTITHTSLAIDASGTPYLVYNDGGNGSKATVMKYNGTAWVTVGSAGFSAGAAFGSLAIDTSGTPYFAYEDVGNSAKATVMKYNGTAWVTVGSAGFTAGKAFFPSLAIDDSGTPYFGYQDDNNGSKATVMKYNGTTWVTVGSAGFSVGKANNPSLAIDDSGTPYLSYQDQGNSSKTTVAKYNGSAWETLGSTGSGSVTSFDRTLVLDRSGVPYVLFRGGGSKATVVKSYPGIASTGIEVTDTSQMIYLTATYPNGCIVNADPIKASDTEPAAIPFIAGTTYQSNAIVNDGSWLHYCDCDNGYRLLSLDTTGSGAVVPADSVWLRLGSKKTQSWTNSGGMVTNSKGGAMIVRKWEVSPSTQPTSDVGLKHYFTQDEFLALQDTLANHNGGTSGYATTLTDPTDMQMYKITSSGKFANPHNSGVTGIVLVNNTTASTDNWVYAPHNSGHSAEFKVSSFFGGGGGGGGAGDSPLPVELIHFDAQAAANHTADLNWATASEINNSHFEIERSYDGIRWEWVGNVTGNGTTSHLTDYNYMDKTIAKSQNTAYYRLKQVDYDGAFEYSDVRVVRFDGRADRLEIAAYPNPFNQEVTVLVNANEQYAIQVTDINGVVVLSEDHTENRTHRLNVSKYTAGVYIIEVTSTQGTQHLKIIKQ